MPDDLTARIRARAASLDATGTRHQPTCHGREHCTCGHQPGALVCVVDAVLDECEALDQTGSTDYRIVAADFRTTLATALGVPTEQQGGA